MSLHNNRLSEAELKVLAMNVSRLSGLLTKGRDDLPAAYLKDEGLRNAYVHYFLPANLYKIHLPLRELAIHKKALFSKDRLRVLDIGSGPGTAILGAMEFFSNMERPPFLEFTAVDMVAENLREAEALFKSCRKEGASLSTIKSVVEKIDGLIKGPFDIIILSNLLNELAGNDLNKIEKRVEILNRILERLLSVEGSCIIIEPSLRDTSREMLEVREGLLRIGYHIYSPCLIETPCPALNNPKDWCHEDVPWKFPDTVKEIDRLTGLRKDSLKFSYLVIRRDALSIKDYYGENSFRVVSEPLISKGKMEFYICGAGGRRMVIRQDKDKTDGNANFEDLRRGDIVRFEGVADEIKRLKVEKSTKVIAFFWNQ